jgi:hypothetical protein
MRVVPGQPDTPGQCAMNNMPSWSCSSSGGGLVACDSDHGAQYRNLAFEFCEVQKDQSVSGNSDWPKPLKLINGWDSQRNVRAFTVLTDANLEARRRAVGIAARQQPGAPTANQLLGMAQAEVFGFNRSFDPHHEDLWHMDWRARLVRFTLSDGSDRTGGVGDAAGSGVPAGAVDVVSGAIDKALGGAGGLQDQFLLH